MSIVVTASDATKIAANYYQDITSSDRKLTVEEIELDENEQFWLVTLGIGDEIGNGIFIPTKMKKEYKIFKIDAATGDVKSMKIRTI